MHALKAETVNAKSTGDKVFKYIGLILSIGAAVSVALIIYRLDSLDFYFSSGPLFIFIIASTGLVALSFFFVLSGLINRRLIIRIVTLALTVLLITANFFVDNSLTAGGDFVKGIQIPHGSSGVIEYSVIAQRSAGIKLSHTKSLSAGIQSADPLREEVETQVEKIARVTFEEYLNLSQMVHATQNEELDVAVVQTALLDVYAEYFPDDYDQLDILTTFKAGNDENADNSSDATIDVTKPFIVFISGLDAFGEIEGMVARSDVNMLVCVDPERYKILLVATPRDYYVQLHGTTGIKDKLAHAGVSGHIMSTRTIEDLYDIKTTYQALINFDTIVQLVDIMGGIVVDNPATFGLWDHGFAEGQIWLDGYNALLFSRARKSLENGDVDRVANQQIVIQGIFDRITDPEIVIHYASIFETMTDYFRTNIPPVIITQLFSRQIALGGDWTIEKMVAQGTPAVMPTYSMGDLELDVLIPDEQSVEEIKKAISDFMDRVD